jgi:hypothetical protein
VEEVAVGGAEGGGKVAEDVLAAKPRERGAAIDEPGDDGDADGRTRGRVRILRERVGEPGAGARRGRRVGRERVEAVEPFADDPAEVLPRRGDDVDFLEEVLPDVREDELPGGPGANRVEAELNGVAEPIGIEGGKASVPGVETSKRRSLPIGVARFCALPMGPCEGGLSASPSLAPPPSPMVM